MATDIKYTLNAQLADNTVTKDNPDDKILEVIYAGTADKERILAEMMAVNPGLEQETLRHVLDLENRVIQKLLLTGYRVNNGLFLAEARCRGTVANRAWDEERNSIYVNLTQGKDLREAIEATTVNITGQKDAVMYIAGGQNVATKGEGFTATAGRAFTLTGAKLKVVGDDPAVGIKLTDADGTDTQVTEDLWVVNQPSRVTFIIPAGLEDGVYTLTLTTQYSGSGQRVLKEPRSISQTIVLGEAPDSGETGSDSGDDGDHQLG